MKFKHEQLHLNKRVGFFLFATILFWIKSYIALRMEFSLGVTGFIQQFILLLNPLPLAVVLLSLALYMKKGRSSYTALMFLYFLLSILLYANILYYREFTDFLTSGTIMGAGNVSGGLFASSAALMKTKDVLYWIDFVFLLALLLFKKVKIDYVPFKKRNAAAITVLGLTLLAGNLTLAESDRPQLLLRTFDRNYIVKYLGVNFYAGYDAVKTAQNNRIKASADESDMVEVQDYVTNHYAAPNPEMFGIAEDRNVFYVSLESLQQFMIDYDLEDENGESHEVLPFLNSLFHDEASYSFSNFFHQVGQGKTSDAEMLLENSLFGLPQGGAFSQVGSSNTFHSASKILQSEKGYTSAVFHGNVGSFWNRNDTYQSFGVDYFFDSNYYTMDEDRTLEYGLKDKLFFAESAQYLEQLPQPFYTKWLTVSNHFPYPLDEPNHGIPAASTGDATIDNYFVTANYLDQAMEEWFTYLKEAGIYENSIFVLYGDHYGVSNLRNHSLAPLLGKDSAEWTAYDNTMMQRVPLIIHVPGRTDGKVSKTIGGQVDVMPTVMHMLGIQTQDYMMLGSDLFSPDHEEWAAFRNGTVVGSDYTVLGSKVYNTLTGMYISDPLPHIQKRVEELSEKANEQLTASDHILIKDLLRFYTPEAMVNTANTPYEYINQLHEPASPINKLRNEKTSILFQNHNQSTVDLYQTNAPELMEPEEDELNEEVENESDNEVEEVDEPLSDTEPTP